MMRPMQMTKEEKATSLIPAALATQPGGKLASPMSSMFSMSSPISRLFELTAMRSTSKAKILATQIKIFLSV